MDRKGDHLDEAERKAREKCHQEMDEREAPRDGRYVATQPEEKRREKEDGYGNEIEKAMKTRVQKIHELIIARAQIGGVSTTREDEALLHKGPPPRQTRTLANVARERRLS